MNAQPSPAARIDLVASGVTAAAREGFRLGFEDCARHIARALAGTTDGTAVEDELPAAQRFVELALHPLYMHAFFGADLAELRDRAPACVAEVVDFLLPARP